VAPEEHAASWDNVGLLCGDARALTETVVLALDVRPSTIEFAIEKEAGLIVAHHPLIFAPLKRIDRRSTPGKELSLLLENGIALYAAHTNVDSSEALSMNASMGRRLPFKDFGPVAAPIQSPGLKLVTFVPSESVVEVREALSAAGAGAIGDYSECAFSIPGTGSFRGGESTHPAIGERGRLEEVSEKRLEMLCPKNRLDAILLALWDSHPYEEVAYDLYPLSGYQSDSHYLWRGELEVEMTLADFAGAVRDNLGEGIAPVKYAGPGNRPIRTVAWCSGSGKSLIRSAAGLRVDAYLTGDTGHHDALEALSLGMALVDIDHYYSERFFMENLHHFLSTELEGEKVTFLPDPTGPVYVAAPEEELQ
jgi:dinuclear metal center YbgI/SA1388 family protein